MTGRSTRGSAAKGSKFKCKYCGKVYMDKKLFADHKREAHLEEMSLTSEASSVRSGATESLVPRRPAPIPAARLRQQRLAPTTPSTARLRGPSPAKSPPEAEEPEAVETSQSSTAEDTEPEVDTGNEENEGSVEEPETTPPPPSPPPPPAPATKKTPPTSPKRGRGRSRRNPMPLPIGKKVKIVDSRGNEREEWLRNPKLKGA